MDEYYIASEKGPLGPYTPQQLRERRLQPDTMVWRNGLTEWVRADSLNELEEVLNAPIVPPTFNREQYDRRTRPETPQAPQFVYPDDDECPPTYRWLAILSFFGLIPCAIISLIFSNKVRQQWDEGNREGAMKSSRIARNVGLIGVLVGIPISLLYIYMSYTDPFFMQDLINL